ncbi:ABC transporter ATP-binding protein [soil metagenome]
MQLVLDNLSKRVGQETHLYPMSLTFQSGLNVLLGQTRAGKTSLMRLMAGLDRPTTGRILVDGDDVTKRPLQKRSVAFVYQQFINYPSLTVFENIASPLRVRGGLSAAELKQKVQDAAETMHIGELLGRLPAELSGGQQQRTAIARALVKEADLLLMDEPLVNLDYKLREQLRTEMRNIFAERDATVVYATTEPQEALLLGGRTVVLDQGRLLQTGETLQVYHRPASQRVGEVFSDPPMNLLTARLEGATAVVSDTLTFPVPEHMRGLAAGSYRLGVRANHLGFSATGEHAVAVPGSVELAEISGSETFVHVDHREGSEQAFRAVAQLEGVHKFDYGQQVTLFLDPKNLYAFDPQGDLAAAPQRGTV